MISTLVHGPVALSENQVVSGAVIRILEIFHCLLSKTSSAFSCIWQSLTTPPEIKPTLEHLWQRSWKRVNWGDTERGYSSRFAFHSLSFIPRSLAAHNKYAPTQPIDWRYIFKTTFVYCRVTSVSMTQGKLGLVKLHDDPPAYLRSILGQS